MSIQIVISRQGGGVVFSTPSGVQQSDLVFWLNNDSEAHFPVPWCGRLLVAPGQTTEASPFQAFVDTTPLLLQQPMTVEYKCALHSNESGTYSVTADTAGTPPAGSAPVNPQAVKIDIGAGGTFATVDVAQGDTVYWANNDSREHWPVPNCSGLLVAPGKTSNGLQAGTSNAPRSPFTNPTLPTTGPPPLPTSVVYGCAIPGHESESGTINVYDNLAGLPSPPTVTQGLPAVVVTGGKSPYTIQQDPNHPEITIEEMPPDGGSNGVAILLTQPPKSSGTITVQVNVTDGLGKTFNQPVQIVVGG